MRLSSAVRARLPPVPLSDLHILDAFFWIYVIIVCCIFARAMADVYSVSLPSIGEEYFAALGEPLGNAERLRHEAEALAQL